MTDKEIFVGESARLYDTLTLYDPHGDPEVIDQSVSFLAELAGEGPVLEFGAGTGRIALPLQALGVDVHAIEISNDMGAELLAKPGGTEIKLTIGDYLATRVPGAFSLVFLVYHGLASLQSQAEQVTCFRNAAEHLQPGGNFLVELEVPQVRRTPPGETRHLARMNDDYIESITYEFATQHMVSQEYFFFGDRALHSESRLRYAWPAELDLMAELAGLRLKERWADWSRSPFTGESNNHISVWEKVD